MKSIKKLSAILILITAQGCSHSSSSSGGSTCTTATKNASNSLITSTNTNTIPVYIADTSTTGSIGYTNEPLVSVTICSPNHSSSSECQTISNILLDTGSFGLRIFSSAIASNVVLTAETVTINSTAYKVGVCQAFGTGADWGAVQNADVIMGNQTATNIPIQVINHSSTPLPSNCASLDPDTDPCSAGYNGILGVGMFAEDCGSDCTVTSTSTNPGQYFACNDNGCFDAYTCSGSTCVVPIPLSKQVINPIAKFASGYNNGLSLAFSTTPNPTGSSGIAGSMTMGIGTTAGNTPGSNVVVYAADANGMTDGNGSNFLTLFNSVTYGNGSKQSFIDSGSNGLFFPTNATFPTCSDGSGFFCPSTETSGSAKVGSYGGTASDTVGFFIGNATTLFNTNNSAFYNLGGNTSSIFDWGLPFFFGRTTYVGLDGTSATFNSGTKTGPYWAF